MAENSLTPTVRDPEMLIRAFLKGEMDIITFRGIYDKDPAINDYLQGIIDDMRACGKEVKKTPYKYPDGRVVYLGSGIEYLLNPASSPGLQYGNHEYDSVRNFLTYEMHMLTHDVETAAGALAFYDGVYSIYRQVDQSIPELSCYGDDFSFALDVIPDYLSGSEAEKYIQKHIIPLFPKSMKKGERKKAIRAKIKEEFKSEKGYPC